MQAIILAGGKGTRLKPYTTVLPKPLMPIGDHPIMEVCIRQLKKAGFTQVTIAVGHLAGLIEAFFGNGEKWGIEISYSREDIPLGTAGPISLIRELDENFLVMNGDILTDINFKELFAFHLEHGGVTTLATFQKEVNINLGVIKTDPQALVTDYIEKPTMYYQISSGIYVFNRRIVEFLEIGKYKDFPHLINELIQRKEKVITYPMTGYWFDIGRREDYETAIEQFETLKTGLL